MLKPHASRSLAWVGLRRKKMFDRAALHRHLDLLSLFNY